VTLHPLNIISESTRQRRIFYTGGSETLHEGRREYGRKYQLNGMMSQPKNIVQQNPLSKSNISSDAQNFFSSHRNRILITVSIREFEMTKS
jgi:hypothetical protein